VTVAWVVGARGLLGSALVREIRRRDQWMLLDADPMPWSAESRELTDIAATTMTRLIDLARAHGDDWSVIWAAGAGVTSSSEEVFERELGQLAAVLEGVRSRADRAPTAGTLFYASSAGGVYAGSSRPPFTEHSDPLPISPYGRYKLRAEQLVASTAQSIGAASLVGRIANLYGPGQRLDKPQGLISHIAMARFTARPASIYVSLDTLRDYILVDDCAALVLDGLERGSSAGGAVTKIMASGQATTIATLLGQFRAISGGRPKVVLGTSAAGALQAHDLRLRSVVWPDLDRRRGSTLPAGIHATLLDILATVQAGQPSSAAR
jgi:UDP-glucose 4-epimerase